MYKSKAHTKCLLERLNMPYGSSTNKGLSFTISSVVGCKPLPNWIHNTVQST